MNNYHRLSPLFACVLESLGGLPASSGGLLTKARSLLSPNGLLPLLHPSKVLRPVLAALGRDQSGLLLGELSLSFQSREG